MLAQLLDDIDRDFPREWQKWVHVVEDVWHDSPEYPDQLKRRADRWTVVKSNGVDNYFLTIREQWEWMRIVGYDRLLQIPDDVRLVPNFFRKVERIWQSIKDPKKVCLSPLRDQRTVNWTGWEMLDVGPAMLSQWSDLAIWADADFLNAIGELPQRTIRRSEGSGVGSWISRHMHAHGYRMYHVKKTLLKHRDHDSVMHPIHRKKTPLIA